MTYVVQIRAEALQTMAEIHRYIAEELMEPEYAFRQYNRIADAIMRLAELPARFPLVRFQPQRSLGLHRMPVDNYPVFFVIREKTVIVTTILYSASDIENRI